MADNQDRTAELQEQVRAALQAGAPLAVYGNGSKAFYGRAQADGSQPGTPLSTHAHRGIVNYEPTELIATVRAGTPLRELEEALLENGQMLPFEPPRFGSDDTVGGAVAAGIAGPRRPFTGSVRDAVLGVRMINGHGEVVRFGGEVMKNVAGYDLSRPMAGSLGTLGVLLEISLKVLPRPVAESSRSLAVDQFGTYRTVADAQAHGAPISGAVHDGEQLHIRLSGAESAVREAERRLGGRELPDADGFWRGVRHHHLPFFEGQQGGALWRLSLPPAFQPPVEWPGPVWLDWGGQQAWMRTEASDETVRAVLKDRSGHAVGHATRFRGGDRTADVFQPLDPAVEKLHRRLKSALDPHGLFNPGRYYPDA